MGMVSGSQYIQEYPSGNLKEAGLKPFFVYKAAADAKLNELIIVTHEDQDCNIYPPAKNEYSEVIIIKQDGKLILRRLFFFFPEEMDKLRQNMRYVGAE